MAKNNKTTTAAAQPKTVQMSAAHKIAQGLFASQKTLNEVSVTSDGTAFYTKSDANNHARTLKDKAVTTVKRSDLAAMSVEQKPAPAPVKDGEGKNGNPTEGNEGGENNDNPDNK